MSQSFDIVIFLILVQRGQNPKWKEN